MGASFLLWKQQHPRESRRQPGCLELPGWASHLFPSPGLGWLRDGTSCQILVVADIGESSCRWEVCRVIAWGWQKRPCSICKALTTLLVAYKEKVKEIIVSEHFCFKAPFITSQSRLVGIVTKAGHRLMRLITPCLLPISGRKLFSPGLCQNSVSFDSPSGRAYLSALIPSEIKPMRLKLGFEIFLVKVRDVSETLPSSILA